jgi:2-methylisocitrate lyase-like PEP mutase family enzyme
MDRAEAYYEAGADIMFIEAPQSLDEMKQLTAHFAGRIPLLANMVEGGKTPIQSTDDLAEIGYKIVIFPGGAVRAIAHHLTDYFGQLLANGNNTKFSKKMYDFNGLNDIIETNELLNLGVKYQDKN